MTDQHHPQGFDERGWYHDGKGHVIVHADGGDCHGTPLLANGCPRCGISPDMQSTEFWRVDLVKPYPSVEDRRTHYRGYVPRG